MAKILWINPIGTDAYDETIKDGLEKIRHPENEVEVVSLKRGPTHLEYMLYEALATPDILRIVKEAERNSYDAAVIGCFYDLALNESREIVRDMAVTAPAEACSYLASTLGYKFSVIVTRDKCIPQMMNKMIYYGMKDKIASFKSLGISTGKLQEDEEGTLERIKEKAIEAIEEDGAEVIILGCTLQFGFYEKLQQQLKVPVLDAIIASFKFAEYLAELKSRFGWVHSKVCAYEAPPISEIEEMQLDNFNIV